jgi:hypothetical protein
MTKSGGWKRQRSASPLSALAMFAMQGRNTTIQRTPLQPMQRIYMRRVHRRATRPNTGHRTYVHQMHSRPNPHTDALRIKFYCTIKSSLHFSADLSHARLHHRRCARQALSIVARLAELSECTVHTDIGLALSTFKLFKSGQPRTAIKTRHTAVAANIQRRRNFTVNAFVSHPVCGRVATACTSLVHKTLKMTRFY